MKKIKFISLMLSLILVFPFALSACNGEEEATTKADETTDAPAQTNAPEATEAVTTAEETTAEEIKVTEPPKSIKILAIGNSFSTDSMEYLYDILKAGGLLPYTRGK